MADNDRKPKLTVNPKKKTILGRKWEKAKIQKLSSHVIGLPCNCKRLRCFEVTTDIERNALIAHFNSLKSKDQQDSMIASLISIKTIKQRRPRQSEEAAKLHNHAYEYCIKVERAVTVPVCFPALSNSVWYHQVQSWEDPYIYFQNW